MQGEVMIWGKC